MKRIGLKKLALTPKKALIASSLLSLLLSIEFNSDIYIIHNQISFSSLLLAIIYFSYLETITSFFLDGHTRKTYQGIFTPLIRYGLVLVISFNPKSTGLFTPSTALGGGVFSTPSVKLDLDALES